MNFAINELTPQELEQMLNRLHVLLHILELDCLLLALEASLDEDKGDIE